MPALGFFDRACRPKLADPRCHLRARSVLWWSPKVLLLQILDGGVCKSWVERLVQRFCQYPLLAEVQQHRRLLRLPHVPLQLGLRRTRWQTRSVALSPPAPFAPMVLAQPSFRPSRMPSHLCAQDGSSPRGIRETSSMKTRRLF